jgi:pimeloyl-ACP methyl ester carboxylesterase
MLFLLSLGISGAPSRGTFTQTLNHFTSSDTRTFPQSFVLDSTYERRPITSIIVRIGGNCPLNDADVQAAGVVDLASRIGSPIYALELRFFGRSDPRPNITVAGLSLLSYLSVEQAMEDVAAFIEFVRGECGDPGNCTVAVVGSSYGGSLAAWFRLKYPTSADAGAWASSAPIDLRADFSGFDNKTSEVIGRLNGGCNESIHKMFNRIEESLTKGDPEKIRESFGFSGNQDLVSILYVIAEVVASAPQYYRVPKPEYVPGLNDFCSAAAKNDLGAFATAFKNTLNGTGQSQQSLDPLSYTFNNSLFRNERAWWWLKCTQLGWFQTSDGFRSSLINMSYFDRVCETLFGFPHRSPKYLSRALKGVDIPATNVYFVNGELDGWSKVGVTDTSLALDRRVLVLSEGTHGLDMNQKVAGDHQLNRVRKTVVAQMALWVERQLDANRTCGHGFRILSRCRCNTSNSSQLLYGSENCSVLMHPYKKFEVVAVVAVALITILLLGLGAFVWCSGRQDPGAPAVPM